MTRRTRAFALALVTALSVSGCGAANAVLGIHPPPKANPSSVPLTLAQAASILTRDFTAAQQGETTAGATVRAVLRTAYTGEGLRAANARVRLAGVQPTGAVSPLLAPKQPRLLAVPRGFGYPRVILAQTVASEGPLPILYLLTSPDAATPYRISASATMLPGSSLKPFDPLTKGSPLVTDDVGLAVSDTALLKTYAAGMSFPAKAGAKSPVAPDSLLCAGTRQGGRHCQSCGCSGSFLAGPQGRPRLCIRGASGLWRRAGLRRPRAHRLFFGEVGSGRQHGREQGVRPAERQEADHQGGLDHHARVRGVRRAPVPGQATLVAASEQVVAGSGS